MTSSAPFHQHLPRLEPIEAYGNGGFRFGGMSHKGSLLCLPSGIYGWDVVALEGLEAQAFARVFDERDHINFLLFGVGRAIARPSREIRAAFEAAGIGLEAMDTGAACRTFNVLLAEGRRVAAALIAVE